MQIEHHQAKWQTMQACDPLFAAHVRAGFKVRGRFLSRGERIDYTACGTVKSGHNDTTSGNSLINVLICAGAMRSLGMSGHIIVLGDDLLAHVAGPARAQELCAAEAQYGISPEVKTPAGFAEATFISGSWLFDGRRHLFMPQPGRLLARLWWTVRPPSQRRVTEYRYGVAMGLLSTYRAFPIIGDFLEPYRDDRHHGVPPPYRPSGILDVEGFDFDRAFCDRYGLTRSAYRELRSFLRRLPTQPAYYASSPADVILQRDVPEALAGDEGRLWLLERNVFGPRHYLGNV
jgi:hypothetical protein